MNFPLSLFSPPCLITPQYGPPISGQLEVSGGKKGKASWWSTQVGWDLFDSVSGWTGLRLMRWCCEMDVNE